MDNHASCMTRKRIRGGKFDALEKEVLRWIQEFRSQGGQLSDTLLIAHAKRLRDEIYHIKDDDFKVSNGWVQNFKQRHRSAIRMMMQAQEAQSASVEENEKSGMTHSDGRSGSSHAIDEDNHSWSDKEALSTLQIQTAATPVDVHRFACSTGRPQGLSTTNKYPIITNQEEAILALDQVCAYLVMRMEKQKGESGLGERSSNSSRTCIVSDIEMRVLESITTRLKYEHIQQHHQNDSIHVNVTKL
jgi:hypothetical protein